MNLQDWVPVDYIEFVYDVSIQLATEFDFAHEVGLVHGFLDLSKIKIQKGKRPEKFEEYEIANQINPYDNMEFKVTDFAPNCAVDLPLSEEASYWPFQKNKL